MSDKFIENFEAFREEMKKPFDKDGVLAAIKQLRKMFEELEGFRRQLDAFKNEVEKDMIQSAAGEQRGQPTVVKIRERHSKHPLRIRNAATGQLLRSMSIDVDGFRTEWALTGGISLPKERLELAQQIAEVVGGELIEEQLSPP